MQIEIKYNNHFDEQGFPVVKKINVQSSVGLSPQERNIDIHQWGLSIRCQLQILEKKISKLEKRDNYLLFNF
jgi:hypothetical protein